MNNFNEKKKCGLYEPCFESDACGTGFIAHIKGKQTHQMVLDALSILDALDHRGARGADPNEGDGAGILMQMPDDFFQKKAIPPSRGVNK